MKIHYYDNGVLTAIVVKYLTIMNSNSEIHTEKGFLCKIEDFLHASPLVNTSNFIGG